MIQTKISKCYRVITLLLSYILVNMLGHEWGMKKFFRTLFDKLPQINVCKM